ncbi:MAG: hypothetical protein DI629_04005 [Mesorhizobium amorphae]|nr:MAG: hypothetical protein DI629_04005 [Mesorhizobium amorphae]
MRPASRLHRLLADRSGNVGLLAALMLPACMTLTALAIDHGALYRERRALQNMTDIAAISAAMQLNDAGAAARNHFMGNGVKVDFQGTGGPKPANLPPGAAALLQVETGRYALSAAVASDQRFTPGGKPANAARVSFRRPGTLYFGDFLMAPPTIGTTAIARQTKLAGFTIGSRLLRLEGGLANKLLGALLKSEISLTAMDYRALVDARVKLLPMLERLNADLKLQAATYDQVLAAKVPPGALAAAMAAVPGVDNAAATALRRFGTLKKAEPVVLGKLLSIGSAGASPLGTRGGAGGLEAGVMQIMQAAAVLSNGTNQVSLDVQAGIPGLLDVHLDLAIGEPPQGTSMITLGEEGTKLYTAQTRLVLTIGLKGPGGLLGSVVTLPLYLQIASGEAELTEISCRHGRAEPSQISVLAKPGILDTRIASIPAGSLADWRKMPSFGPAKLVSLPLVSVDARARFAAEGKTQKLVFDAAAIDRRAIKTVNTTALVGPLLGSLMGDLTLDVNVIGLGLGLPRDVTKSIGKVLEDAAAPVDTLVFSLLDTLGISLGEADIQALGGSCGRSVLVN